MVVGLVGTTITPWMQFYLQASIVEKGVDRRHYALTRLDVILGCVVTDVIAFFIVVACAATIYKAGGGTQINDAADAALALKPFAGQFASALFAVGLVNASLLAAAILPLATAFNICEEIPRLRGRGRPPLFRSTHFLLALHPANRRRCLGCFCI